VNQDKSKLVNKMIGGDNNNHTKNNTENNISKSSSSHSLSLQEKQRILAEQESAQNRPASKSPTPSKPVNLTDSLINKSMSMNQISANPIPWNSSNKSSNWPNGGMSGGGGGSSIMPQTNLNTASPGFGNFSQPGSFSSLSHQQPAKPDLSAFDSLMSGPVQPKQPMNAMQGPMGIRPIQPMMPSNPNQFNRQPNQPQAKPLSFNEINDFLS